MVTIEKWTARKRKFRKIPLSYLGNIVSAFCVFTHAAKIHLQGHFQDKAKKNKASVHH